VVGGVGAVGLARLACKEQKEGVEGELGGVAVGLWGAVGAWVGEGEGVVWPRPVRGAAWGVRTWGSNAADRCALCLLTCSDRGVGVEEEEVEEEEEGHPVVEGEAQR